MPLFASLGIIIITIIRTRATPQIPLDIMLLIPRGNLLVRNFDQAMRIGPVFQDQDLLPDLVVVPLREQVDPDDVVYATDSEAGSSRNRGSAEVPFFFFFFFCW